MQKLDLRNYDITDDEVDFTREISKKMQLFLNESLFMKFMRVKK